MNTTYISKKVSNNRDKMKTRLWNWIDIVDASINMYLDTGILNVTFAASSRTRASSSKMLNMVVE